MFMSANPRRWAVAVLLSTWMAPSMVWAGHGHHRAYTRPEVDIDRLKAKLRYDCGEWSLSVKYEVETEDAAPGRCDLILRLKQHGRYLVDERGRPITFAIPLDRPHEVDEEEFEYQGRFRAVFGRGLFSSPGKLELDARVVDRHTGRTAAHKRTKVKYKR